MASSFRTMEALRVVTREARDPAMEEILRDMERARMTAEDFAQGSARDLVGTTWRMRESHLFATLFHMDRTIHRIDNALDDVRDGYSDPGAAVVVIGAILDDATQVTRDQAAPDQAAPDQAAPDQTAPDQAAPDQAAPVPGGSGD